MANVWIIELIYIRYGNTHPWVRGPHAWVSGGAAPLWGCKVHQCPKMFGEDRGSVDRSRQVLSCGCALCGVVWGCMCIPSLYTHYRVHRREEIRITVTSLNSSGGPHFTTPLPPATAIGSTTAVSAHRAPRPPSGFRSIEFDNEARDAWGWAAGAASWPASPSQDLSSVPPWPAYCLLPHIHTSIAPCSTPCIACVDRRCSTPSA